MTDISKIRPAQGVVPAAPIQSQPDNYHDGDPIVLFAEATIQAGSTEIVNAVSLRNPTSHPIEVSEIRLHGESVSAAMAAGIVGVKFILPGNVGVSDDFIPFWMFDRSEQLVIGESFADFASQVTTDSSEADYVWRLRTPLLLMPGEILTPEVDHAGLIQDDIEFIITYNGRVRVGIPIPTTRIVPFVATWQAPSIDFDYVAADYDPNSANDNTIENASPENTLINSSDSPVTIHRITGRLLTESDTADGAEVFSDEIQPIIDMLINVNMQTSYGYQITRDFIPFRLLFARDTRDFECSLPLNPGDYLLAEIQATQGDIVPFDNGDDTFTFPTFLSPMTPQIGMVGEREVPL